MNTDTKSMLFRITRELIDGGGVEAVSMREVGKQAGLSRTALYRHFDSKQSLLASIVVEDFKLLSSNFSIPDKNPENCRQQLSAILNAYYQFAMERPEHYQLMFNTRWDSQKYPEIKKAAGLLFKMAEEYVKEALAISNPSNLTSVSATAILYSFIHGLVELHITGHTESEKGLFNSELLINQFIERMF